ncbi:putative ribonuclease H-like domain-containing protein [Tanacetum coccineum]
MKKEEYDIWAMEMEHYLEYIDNDVWKVIQNGNSKKRISTGKDGVVRVLPSCRCKNSLIEKGKGRQDTILLMAIQGKSERFSWTWTMQKEIWEAIWTSSEGVRKRRYDIFQQILSQVGCYGVKYYEDAIHMKFYKKTGRRVRIDGNKPVGFDKKKLECFKCHNTGHFARECPSKGTNDGKKRDSFYQDQGAGKKEQNQNYLLTMDDGVVNWGEHTVEEEEKTNHALMAISSNNEVSLCSKTCIDSYNKLKTLCDEQTNQLGEQEAKILAYTLAVKKLEAQVEKGNENARKKRNNSDKIVDSWKNSSKNLWKLVDSGMTSNSKVGLGYEIQSNNEVLSYEEEMNRTVFKCTEEDFLNKPLYSRFSKTDNFKGVPHPLTGDYTPKPQEEIDDSLYVYGKKGPQKPKTSDSDDKFSENSVTSSKEVVSEPKPKEAEPSCVTHVKTSRQPMKNQGTPKVRNELDMDYVDNENRRRKWGIDVKPQKDHPLKNMEDRGKLKQEYSNARTPQQNGVAKRMNRTLIEAARTMLADSLLPTTFWAEAVSTACYIFNRLTIFNKPQKGIFDKASYDDEGMVYDFNNLLTEVPVSPIPTLRIHNIHPQSQIIGDPKFICATRRNWVEAMQEELLQFRLLQQKQRDEKRSSCRIKQGLVRPRSLTEEGIDYALMKARFQMSSMGELIFFLGLQVKQKTDGIFISQDKYVADMLKKFDLASVKTAITPMETKMALTKDEEADAVDVHLYRFMIESLSTLRANPIWAYGISDSNYARANLDRKSTTGGCQFLGSRLISWQCKKQTIMATFTTEAEYVAAASCCCQVLWIQNQMLDYGFNFMNTKIYIDNESTICIVKNPVYHSKTKHIEIRHHFIRDSYEKKLIRVEKIHTDFNVADLLTKAFDGPRFNFLVVNIGMINQ